MGKGTLIFYQLKGNRLLIMNSVAEPHDSMMGIAARIGETSLNDTASERFSRPIITEFPAASSFKVHIHAKLPPQHKTNQKS